jgi:Circularly permutated YpsA SLOG family
MLERIISAGQTGADQGGLRAARAAGIPTGGFASHDWETETGPAPWLAGFGLVVCPESGYAARTVANVKAADLTLWFGSTESPGAKLTLQTVGEHGKTLLVITPGMRPSKVVECLRRDPRLKVVNVSGDRESKAPGIGIRAERFLAGIIRQLRAKEGQPQPHRAGDG